MIASFDLTIPSGQTDSNVYVIPSGMGVEQLTIFAPAALTGVVTLYLGVGGSTFASLLPAVLGVTNVTIVAAKAAPLLVGPFRSIGVKSGSAEGAARVFTVVAQIE